MSLIRTPYLRSKLNAMPFDELKKYESSKFLNRDSMILSRVTLLFERKFTLVVVTQYARLSSLSVISSWMRRNQRKFEIGLNNQYILFISKWPNHKSNNEGVFRIPFPQSVKRWIRAEDLADFTDFQLL